MKQQKRYIERNDLNRSSHLEVNVYYYKGGISAYTGQMLPRGYYLSVRPVILGNGTVSFDLFSGCKRLLLEVSRYTDKQFTRAVEMAKSYENEMIAAVVAECRAA
jgi:hypothetical protein